jgi:hypothetical protein
MVDSTSGTSGSADLTTVTDAMTSAGDDAQTGIDNIDVGSMENYMKLMEQAQETQLRFSLESQTDTAVASTCKGMTQNIKI